jgi:hypothetical protein
MQLRKASCKNQFSTKNWERSAPDFMEGRMQTKMRYCPKCGYITPHCVVNKAGIVALLCQNCVLRWASEREVKQKNEEEVRVNQQT